ncbi:hypothetical protein EZ449_19105 [Pedobacter frigidisoli]|uniref:Uncharacterized protein n=1 Tax=Pedobacter frigidisoli TaxID=2530455 RepID=A0A4R0NPK1_9SPHI|nr:hypothetical protein [Pedobacter frigidisoli]TCD02169.1 hypothetical protein EZ449_19105 [Pedobacter frigidisoli]
MKNKLTLSLLIIFFQFKIFAQTQIKVIKKPTWNIKTSYDSKYGSKLDLSGNAIAMIVDVPKADFAVVVVDDKLSQKWLVEMNGFPLAIGKFKQHVMIVSATDRSFFKSFTNQFKATLLDEKTGRIISEKIIYDGSKDYVETPDFFFSKDGSYFKMAVRLTGLKRKVHVGLPVVGFFTALKLNKDFNESQSYTVIDFNDKLEQVQKMEPEMPDGDSWKASCGDDGSFIISTLDAIKGKCHVAIYLSSNSTPLKTVTMPIDLYNSDEISSIFFASSKTPLINYVALFYKTKSKEMASFVARVDFNTGTYALNNEIFDKAHVRDLEKSFVPANKKFDELDFGNIKSLNVRHLEEINDQLLLTVSSQYSVYSSHTSATFDGSVLMSMFDQKMKKMYHQFIPRLYVSQTSEGSEVSFNVNNRTLRILANSKYGADAINALYAEMDITSGAYKKIDYISKDDIKGHYYANTSSISWLNDSFVVPFVERVGVFSKNVDLQLLQLKY